MKSLFAGLLVSTLLTGCYHPTTDITKTAKGLYDPTKPDVVEILETKPDRRFVELGSISGNGWKPSETAKMHNDLRAKAADLGANAVLITNSGIVHDHDTDLDLLWVTGVAIRWEDQTTPFTTPNP